MSLILPLIYRYELANCYCMKLEWQKASELYLPLIEEPKFQVRIICCLQLGSCYLMMDQKEKAMTVFNRMLTFSGKKSHFDPVVLRQTKRYVACGGNFAAFELLYLRRDLAKMIPIMTTVLKSLDDMAAKTKALEPPPIRSPPAKATTPKTGGFSLGGFKQFANSTLNSTLNQINKKKEATDFTYDDRASYLLLKGSILKALNKQEEAIELFKEVLLMQEYLNEKLYVPYCFYELGESQYVLGNLKEAEDMMRKCSKISGYDWEDPLKIRLKVTMDQLKKRSKPSSEETKYISIDAMVGNSNDDDKDPLDDNKSEPTSDDEAETKSVGSNNDKEEED